MNRSSTPSRSTSSAAPLFQRGRAKTRPLRAVTSGERALAVVAIDLPVVGDEQVGVAIVVVVAGARPVPTLVR